MKRTQLAVGVAGVCLALLLTEMLLPAQTLPRFREQVISKAVKFGYQLVVADLDGDGRDEIVSGFRGKGYQLSIYQATDTTGEHWRKTVLDNGGMAAADCAIEDFDGDGKPDIACIGASSGNVKLYLNLGT